MTRFLTTDVKHVIIVTYYEVEVACVISTPPDGAAPVDERRKEHVPKDEFCCTLHPGHKVNNLMTVTKVESYP